MRYQTTHGENVESVMHLAPRQGELSISDEDGSLSMQLWTRSNRCGSRIAGHQLLELDRRLSEHDRDNRPDIPGGGRTRLDVGIYQIGGTWPQTRIDED